MLDETMAMYVRTGGGNGMHERVRCLLKACGKVEREG